jgi:hypothetical protein
MPVLLDTIIIIIIKEPTAQSGFCGKDVVYVYLTKLLHHHRLKSIEREDDYEG